LSFYEPGVFEVEFDMICGKLICIGARNALSRRQAVAAYAMKMKQSITESVNACCLTAPTNNSAALPVPMLLVALLECAAA
jgi:hypothetical protein